MIATFKTFEGNYSVPTYDLLAAPTRVWDDERKCYVRKHCSYCTHDAYTFAQEDVTGRYFCGTCVKRNGFKIRAA